MVVYRDKVNELVWGVYFNYWENILKADYPLHT